MNKIAKGTIAGGAAVVLLLGGAGTFALWNDSDIFGGENVSTGNLDLELGVAAWADTSPDADGASFDPATDEIVPGDTVTFTQPITVTAWGKNLRAQLAIDDTDFANNSDEITVSFALAHTGTDAGATITSTGTGADTVWTIDPQVDSANPGDTGTTSTFEATVTITFPATTTGQVDTNVDPAIELADLSLTLAQVRPTP